MATKITKRERYESIVELAKLAEENGFEGFDLDGIVEFCENEVAALDRKAAKAKEAAAKKKAEGDALTDAVLEALTEEFEPIAEIAARIEGEDITVSKVSYRLNALSKAENPSVEKGELTIEGEKGKRKVVGYRLIG